MQFAEEGSSYTLEELLALMIILSDAWPRISSLTWWGRKAARPRRRLGLERSTSPGKCDLESELPSNVATAYSGAHAHGAA